MYSITEGADLTPTPRPQPCCVQLRVLPPCPPKKRLFVVRHGESVWNQGQREANLVALYSQVDHPLNAKGRQQAEGLAASLAAASSSRLELVSDEACALRELCAAPLVLCSPLTRALQTCLIGLGAACGLREAARRVRLVPAARERRNHGAVDSIGCAVGEAEIAERLLTTTTQLYGGDAEAAKAAVGGVALDDLEVCSKWWSGPPAEPKEEVAERLGDLVRQLRYCHEETIVLVSHSHWIRELLREYLADAFSVAQPELGAMLRSHKLSTCGVACLDLDFATADRPIVDVKLLLGTELVK